MQVVRKFEMDRQFKTFTIPAGAVILDPKMQQGNLVFWAMYDPGIKTRERHFGTVETGKKFDLKVRRYIGSVVREYDNYVLHVFELYSSGA